MVYGITLWQSILASIWQCIWHSILAFYLASILTSYPVSFVASILTFSLAFSSGMLSGILSDILFWHSIRNLFWYSFLAFCVAYLFGDSLWLRSGRELSDPELAVEVRRGTLRSSACSWGPAGSTLILSLLSGSGGERCDLALAVAVGGEHSDPELLFGPGGERCDLAHAVEVNNPHLTGPRRSS